MSRRAVFLDRDGVLIDDVGPVADAQRIRVRRDAAAALVSLKAAGFRLVGVSNQAVVARGLASENDVLRVQAEVERKLQREGAPPLDGFYFCPHHPEATDPRYRQPCRCRKPSPGLVLDACRDLDIDPEISFMVGDRLSDIEAGQRAGCRAVWLQTGQHEAPPIVGMDAVDPPRPEHACADLMEAARWILAEASE